MTDRSAAHIIKYYVTNPIHEEKYVYLPIILLTNTPH